MWSSTGKHYYMNKTRHNCDLKLREPGFNREIQMMYNGNAKILTINCEDRTYTYEDQHWPAEIYFYFSLYRIGSKVSLISN